MKLRGIIVVITGYLLVACTGGGDKPGTEQPSFDDRVTAVEPMAQAWSDLDPEAFGAATDDPAAAAKAFTAMTDELVLQGADVVPTGDPACSDAGCTQLLDVTLDVGGIGSWTYQTRASTDGDTVTWEPSLLHPRLTAALAFDRTRELPARALILDRNGRQLVSNLPVWDIGIVPGKTDASTYARLSDILGVDGGALRERAKAANPDWFLPVITLRRADYAPVLQQLLQVAGISIDTGRLPLAPSAGWGRAVLGTVSGATEESIDNAGPLAQSSDALGSSGLQYAFEQQLAGTPGGVVSLVADDGVVASTLWRQPAQPGEPVRTTLDYDVQDAAERAIADQSKTTILVAVQASTGEILADANGPEVTSYNTGFVGQYPPGSTFKVLSSAALIEAGQDISAPAQCPSTTVIDGKRFKNYDFISLPGSPTFADAIAASCNTTVVNEADTLDDDSILGAAADLFGIGAGWGLALDAYSGSVPPSTSLVDRAASMIGQGRVLMSPLGMAMLAATVKSGQAYAPTLVPDVDPGGQAADPLPQGLADDLRQIMRLVVTEGTASSLRGLPGDIGAKTGTAEYGTADPPRTHGWMIGFRGDVAFACLVVDGEGGNSDAGPVLRRFLELAPQG